MYTLPDPTTSAAKTRTSRLLWIGLTVLAIGTGPLVLFIISDAIGLTKNSNPVGFGILALLTFWPGVILTVIGWMRTSRRR